MLRAMLLMEESVEDGVCLCRLQGRLDAATCAKADRHLAKLTALPGMVRLVLDLSRLQFVSSAGLRVLLVEAKRAAKLSLPVSLAAPCPEVRQLLEGCGFGEVLPIHATCEEALQAAPR
jgi:anti-anti-sigma factor